MKKLLLLGFLIVAAATASAQIHVSRPGGGGSAVVGPSARYFASRPTAAAAATMRVPTRLDQGGGLTGASEPAFILADVANPPYGWQYVFRFTSYAPGMNDAETCKVLGWPGTSLSDMLTNVIYAINQDPNQVYVKYSPACLSFTKRFTASQYSMGWQAALDLTGVSQGETYNGIWGWMRDITPWTSSGQVSSSGGSAGVPCIAGDVGTYSNGVSVCTATDVWTGIASW